MEVTKEEVVEIVTGFLLNSPPGEFAEVVTGVWFYLSSPLLSCLFLFFFSPFPLKHFLLIFSEEAPFVLSLTLFLNPRCAGLTV